jgi:hypothetical protein
MSAATLFQLEDFILPQADHDWHALLRPFSPPLPETFEVLLVSRFLDFFLILPDGSVHWLDTGAAGVTQVAGSLAAFEAEFETSYPNWLMVDFVRGAVSRGQVLHRGLCYTYAVPPILDGAYDMDNVVVSPVEPTLAVLGEIFRKLWDVPDGAQVNVQVTQ